MSNHLAVATVTGTLRRTLHAAVQQDVASASATAIRPDSQAAGLPDPGVNIFLYQVTPNAAWRNQDLPTRDARGRVAKRPQIALDLHYLFTFHGDEGQLLPQQVLGSVSRALHARPYLTREAIHNTLGDGLFSYLASSDLAEEVELVKFTPEPFTLEELSKLWSVLFQTTYALSMSYMATVVLIETQESPLRALPVRQRNIGISPFRHAVIQEVVSAVGDDEPIEMNATIVIRGSQLGGAVDRVRVGVADLDPVPDSQTSSGLRVDLTDPALRAGVLGVQIVFEDGSESNVAPLVIRPVIALNNAGVTSTEVPITFTPAVSRSQRVVLFLNELNVGLDHEPLAYSFKAPEDNGIEEPDTETPSITFEIEGVAPGTYLVRVHVDGAENVLTADPVDDSPTFGMYIAPVVEIPS